MNNRSARKLRRVLGLLGTPKTLNPAQRLAYRQLKRRYTKMPAPVKARFWANTQGISATLTPS